MKERKGRNRLDNTPRREMKNEQEEEYYTFISFVFFFCCVIALSVL